MKKPTIQRTHSWCCIEVDHRKPKELMIEEPEFLVCAAFVGLPDPLVLEYQLDLVLTFPYDSDTVTRGILNVNFRTAFIDLKDYAWLIAKWTKVSKEIESARKDGWLCPDLLWVEREDDPRLRVSSVLETKELLYSEEIISDPNLFKQTRDRSTIVPSTIAGAYQLAERFAPAIVRNKKTEVLNERKPEIWQGLDRQKRDRTLY